METKCQDQIHPDQLILCEHKAMCYPNSFSMMFVCQTCSNFRTDQARTISVTFGTGYRQKLTTHCSPSPSDQTFRMMFMSCALAGFVLSVLAGMSSGYSTGAPEGVCGTMMPGHGVESQTSAAPYDIKVSSSSYCGSNSINVTLVGAPFGEEFKGFLCQPRKTIDTYETVGTFNMPTGTQNNCGNKAALTHTSKAPKKSVEFTWTPDLAVKETVHIVCTIVQQKTTLWVKQSISLTYAGVSRCQNPGVLPTTCSDDQQCDNAVGMAVCKNGKCECPSDMKVAYPTDTSCSHKKLGDSCSNKADCQLIADTVCDMNKCQCEPGFKHNTTAGPCYPKVLHDSCTADNECSLVNNSKCIGGTCQCPREGFIEVGNATHKICSATNSATTTVISAMMLIGCLIFSVL